MTPRVSDARDRMVATTAQLLRRQGYNGTGLNQIIEESQAPKGSLYHYFPGGKEELAVEAVRQGAATMEQNIREALRGSQSTAEGLTRVAHMVIEALNTSSFQDACPISTVALETATSSPALNKVCSDAFRSIQDLIGRGLEKEGHTADEASELANLIVSTYQGALLLSRTHQSTEPLERAVRTLGRLLPRPRH